MLITDPKQNKAGNKTFICSKTQDNKNVIVMGYVSQTKIQDLPQKIKTMFSCNNAILLDNGNSKAMIQSGKYIYGPGRNLMDAFIIIEGSK